MALQVKKQTARTSLEVALRTLGFRRKGRATWFLDYGEVLILADVVRSRFRPQYYLDMGLFVKTVQPGFAPKNSLDCHLHFRPHYFQLDGTRWAMLLDAETDIPTAEREEQIATMLREKVLSQTAQLSTGKAVIAYAEEYVKHSEGLGPKPSPFLAIRAPLYAFVKGTNGSCGGEV